MKLQEGECYRLRNGEVVGPLIAKDYESEYKFEDYRKSNSYSWMENGQYFNDTNRSFRDIVEHIPKEKDMKEQMIKGSASVYASGTIGYYDIHVTLSEAERLGAEAQRIKAENEIKAGDWVAVFGLPRIVGSIDDGVYSMKNGGTYSKEKVKKITTPAHIQALNEIYEGMK